MEHLLLALTYNKGELMYNKKYIVEKIEEFDHHNSLYENVEGCNCYLAYFNVGERGWFLYEEPDWFSTPHRVHTSEVKDVEYTDDKVVVTTRNTKLTFKLIK